MNNIFKLVSTIACVLVLVMSMYLVGKGVNFSKQTQKYENVTSNKNTTDNLSRKNPAPLSEKDFIVRNDSSFIELGGKYGDIKTNEKITGSSYANANRAYDVFVYENFTVMTNGNIFSISLTTPVLKTYRGVSVGDPIAKVFENYGAAANKDASYMYPYKGKVLMFSVDENNNVTQIEFSEV